MKELNHCYLEHPALYRHDFENKGFQWIDCHQEEKCVYVFERRSEEETILALFNFSDQTQEYQIRLEEEYDLLMASDMEVYGGNRKYTKKDKILPAGENALKLSPFSAVFYEKKADQE